MATAPLCQDFSNVGVLSLVWSERDGERVHGRERAGACVPVQTHMSILWSPRVDRSDISSRKSNKPGTTRAGLSCCAPVFWCVRACTASHHICDACMCTSMYCVRSLLPFNLHKLPLLSCFRHGALSGLKTPFMGMLLSSAIYRPRLVLIFVSHRVMLPAVMLDAFLSSFRGWSA